jgi:uncharacterized protein (TIGR02217 family)
MTFKESPRFPDAIARGAEGGPMFFTDIAEGAAGDEQRNIGWDYPRHRFRVSINARILAEVQANRAFFYTTRGAAIGFRFKDHTDYTCSVSEGFLDLTAAGTGSPSLQLTKWYTSGSDVFKRLIYKPITSIAVFRNASPVTVGAGAGQIAVSYTAGTVTFVADQSRSITSHTVGASHIFTLASAFSPNLAIGGRIYVTGVTGTAATALNAVSHVITNVAGAVITTSTVTTGLTANGGTAFYYPQPTDALTWSGQFDVPVRFESDWFRAMAETGRHGSWPSIELIETRDIA